MRYAEYTESLKNVITELDGSVLVLIQDANSLLEEFWVDVKARNEFSPFAFNIQKQEATYRIRWGKLYKPKTRIGSEPSRVRMKHIDKGKGDQYYLSQFKGCPAWFEVLFYKYESQLTEIRKAIRANRAIRLRLAMLIAHYEK